ncbi:Imidazolonepropionase [Candidatus Ornithobacterium hominis]|uniref:Imidazolonepropionase n=1 Tax=Candidatus Ornithobacterium hominis TaxID=2497989 RepID=A0A383U0S7_9FLAO|nr:imidazolonepropionase [Candidatus Ornithobacterium hominis]MCT7904937.1 imidazolonepropionase [Candidatus Ornithobacterium hominis]SZD73444.1 Imidazolonepropionase [Candidatus Ornithobacterium hominis]
MKLIGPFAQVLTMSDLPLKGALKDEQLEIKTNAGILIDKEKIQVIDDFDVLKSQNPEAEIVKITGEKVALPGFVDSHTHICWGGTRAKDFAMRNAGKSYLDIAKEGGGIWSTVLNTRKASQEELTQIIIKRADYLLKQGITTVEVKSGYGLSVESELKMLRAIKEANQYTKQNLISTCLAAHTLPKDFDGTHQQYLESIENELFPILVEENLTKRIDAFIEEEAFDAKVTIPYFEKAKDLGFDITVHADQFSTGGSEIAVQVGAVSADHLEVSTAKEIELLANSDTVATALPGASLGLGCPFTPARALLDAGACLAIASDWNPGSAPQGNIIAQAAILASFQKLSNAEVLAGVTARAAYALRAEKFGSLIEGNQANFTIFDTDNYQEITYQQGRLLPEMVYINGEKVFVN